MEQSINHITLKSIAWIRVEPHVTSFGWKGLPTDTHFSISHRPQDDFLNLHFTRNIKGVAIEHKPKIEIARINKDEACNALLAFIQVLLHASIERLRLQRFPGHTCHSGRHFYFPLAEFEKHKNNYRIKLGIINAFHKASKRKGKRKLAISADIFPDLENLASNPAFQDYWIGQLRKLPRRIRHKEFRSAFLVSKEFTGCILMGRAGIFRLREAPINDMLDAFFAPGLIGQLRQYIQTSIQVVGNSVSYDQTKEYNKPFYLSLVLPP